MVTYEHLCEVCGYEWEAVYGMTVDPPTICPKCGVDGKVVRLISGGSGRGIMRKTPQEIKATLAQDTRAIKERAKIDENFRANLVGEEKYHTNLLTHEKLTNELVKIGKRASATRPKIYTSKTKKK